MNTMTNPPHAGVHVRAVDFILLPVSDLDRAVQFYRDTLGLPLAMHHPEYQWAEFSGGNVTLGLHGGAASEAGAGRGPQVALAVDDVRLACARLHAHGVTVIEGPTDFGVCVCARLADPDGNIVLLHRRADGSAG
jgi:predicted enzyme related to lactoylglutathione lyase